MSKKECCNACPFAYTEESERAQNYGCLPGPYEIVRLRVDHGKTWACHEDCRKPCLGGLLTLRERGLPFKVIDRELVTEKSEWPEVGPT